MTLNPNIDNKLSKTKMQKVIQKSKQTNKQKQKEKQKNNNNNDKKNNNSEKIWFNNNIL